MRYVIIGAGAVGGTIGVRLSQAGLDVTLVARGAQLTAIRERGLTLVTPDGEHTARLPGYADPTTGGEVPTLTPDTVLVLTVKSQDTETALRGWADLPVVGGGTASERLPLLTAQNGVANETAAARLFDRVHPVCVWLPATYLEPGRVVASGHPYSGMLHVGAYPDGSDETSRRIAADLAAGGFLAPVRDDVMRWKYGKLLRNLGNAVEALFGRDSRTGSTDELYEAVRTEGETVLDKAGIGYTSVAEEAAERGDRIRSVPVGGTDRQGSSTWQSLARQTGSVETDHLNGEIVLLGRRYGVPTPVNAAIQRAMRRAVRERIPAGTFPQAHLFD
ncbi:2-dehydropantoate 2-reductase N-terminal domain-containing protein [Plantactinospora sp. B5E13]|uniref:ketopantoate reductase family protein n=1 Tax=Plantactinospora sp. B5E13 TaxID=3153758 RepID=UPI00325CF5D9